MTRDLKISLLGAVACHALALYGFHVALSTPAKLMRDTAVDVTLVAAPAAPAAPLAPAAELTPPVEAPQPPEPVPEVKPPEPLPVEPTPEPVIAQPQPLAQPTPVAAVPSPAPASSAMGDNSSPQPGLDRTTTQAQPGEPARTKYRRNPKPAYPPLARRRGQEGLVLLSVRVTVKGRAAEVSLKQSSGHTLLDESAINAVRRWEFEPARIGSLAVESEIEVPVRFRLQD